MMLSEKGRTEPKMCTASVCGVQRGDFPASLPLDETQSISATHDSRWEVNAMRRAVMLCCLGTNDKKKSAHVG